MTGPKALSIPRYTIVYDTMAATTIKIHKDTKHELDRYREYKNESYDEVIMKLLDIAEKAKTKPQLSKEVVRSIEEARARIKNGQHLTKKEMWKRLGI